MRRFRSPVVGVLTLLALVAAALLAGYSPAAAQDNPPAVEENNMRTLSVWAVGTASGSPDIAYAELGVEIRNENIGDALTQANDAMQAVTDALTGFGIETTDIQTTQFNVYQEGQPQPVPGAEDQSVPPAQYVVTNIVRVTVRDISQVSDVIQTALDAGANRVYGLTFGLADPGALRSQARQEAAQSAGLQAQELAQAFNVQLGEPVKIEESGQGGVGPLADTAAFARGGGGPPVSAGELSVTVQLFVTYRVTP